MNLPPLKHEKELDKLLEARSDEELLALRAALLREKPDDHYSRKIRLKILEILDKRGSDADRIAAEMKEIKRDKEGEGRVQGGVGEGQEPGRTLPDQGGSKEAPPTS